MPEDAADLHVERWRDHWVLDHPFDDQVEAMTVRVIALTRSFRAATKAAAAAVGLEDFEYATLHELMIRDTPGRASPTELAEAAKVSPAGMSGRLDAMERKGLVKRTPGREDRRRVDVEATRKGREVWNRAMELRGNAENDAASALTPRELATLNRLLKKMTLRLEQHD